MIKEENKDSEDEDEDKNIKDYSFANCDSQKKFDII